MIKVQKSVYDKPESSDGRRILVMTIWPRGISKDSVDVWMKDLGTPRELIMKWRTGKITWDRFAKEYKKSLKGKEGLLRDLGEAARSGTITLLCSDSDPNRCHRSVLKSAIEEFA